MAEKRTTQFTYLTLFVVFLVVAGGLLIYFSSERAIDAQREGGEGVLQEMAERQAGAEELSGAEEDVPRGAQEALAEGQIGITPDSTLLVDEWLWETVGDQNVLMGAIENLTNEVIGPVQVQFELQDGAGRAVGSAQDETSEIPPGERWEYEIPVENPQAVQAELLDVVIRH